MRHIHEFNFNTVPHQNYYVTFAFGTHDVPLLLFPMQNLKNMCVADPFKSIYIKQNLTRISRNSLK